MKIKKYFLLLPFITSCNTLDESNIDHKHNPTSSVLTPSLQSMKTGIKKVISLDIALGSKSKCYYGPDIVKNIHVHNDEFYIDIEPGVDKGHMANEDCCFVTSFQNNDKVKKTLAGVLDGVGGVNMFDAYEYPMELANHMIESDQGVFIPNEGKGLQEMVGKIHEKVGNTKEGATTVCLTSINDFHLQYYNIGDSMMKVFRPEEGTFVFSTESQQHGFNCPFQLSHHPGGDTVYDGKWGSFELKSEDIVILATDGVWDNLYDSQIISYIQSAACPKDMVCNIIEKASNVSNDPNAETPFNTDQLYKELENLNTQPCDKTEEECSHIKRVCNKHSNRAVKYLCKKLNKLYELNRIGESEYYEAHIIMCDLSSDKIFAKDQILLKIEKLKKIQGLFTGGKDDDITAIAIKIT